jgi:MFS transporter, ACDE family, multidrug resistance protein
MVSSLSPALVLAAVVSPVEKPVASAAYSFVRFIGGGLAPYVAGRLVLAANIHVPFFVAAGAIAAGIAILSTAHGLLTEAEQVAGARGRGYWGHFPGFGAGEVELVTPRGPAGRARGGQPRASPRQGSPARAARRPRRPPPPGAGPPPVRIGSRLVVRRCADRPVCPRR